MASSRKVIESSTSAKDVPIVDTENIRTWDWYMRLYLDQKDPNNIRILDKIHNPDEVITYPSSDEEESAEEKRINKDKREAEDRRIDKTLIYLISAACEKSPEARSHLVCFDGDHMNANALYNYLMEHYKMVTKCKWRIYC